MDIFKKIWKRGEDEAAKLGRDKEVQTWLNLLDDAAEREKAWRKEAQRTLAIYEQQKSADNSSGDGSAFNILYANTETLSPAVYNATPRPVVKRKIDRENPIAVAAAQVLKHVLVHLADTGDSNYTPFDDLQKLAVQEALVPGRGLCKFSYDADIADDGQGAKVVKYETVCGDPVPWNRVLYGYAKQWSNIPWQAFEHFMTRDECKANFGDRIGAAIKLTHSAKDDQDKEHDGPEDAQGVKFAHVYEVWDRRSKRVLFLSEGYPTIIKSEDDPLRLEGFFCAPRPVMFLTRISSLVPQTLYLMYENQAKELEDVTRRIGHLTRAMKIRGFYDGTLEGLDELLSKPENTLVPARNVAALQQGQTLEKSIWFMPLNELIQVLQQLYLNRAQIISVIHQLTGVADIMRGSSAASETLGAQKMKEAWGTMRLKRMQKEVQRFTRDCFRIQAELAAKHFSIETLRTMTGLKFPSMGEKQLAQQEMAMLQAQAQQAQMAQQAGQPVPPELIQQGQAKAKELQAILAKPSWEEINDFLKNDSIRNFTIDIETNSTIDIEATEDKQELAEMMNSMGQLLNGVFPMVKEGVLPFQAAKVLMLSVVNKFRMGDEVEETFRAMQEPQAKEDPAAKKVEAEMKRDEAKFAQEQKASEQELAQKQQLAQMELDVERERLQIMREENQLKLEFMRAKHTKDMEMLAMKAVMPPAAPQPAEGGSEGN